MPEALLGLEASEPVRSVVDAIGRTEDARFSPNGRCLAILAFSRDEVVLLALDIAPASQLQTIGITDYLILFSPALRKPHGIAFVDDNRFLVASRDGYVALFEMPDFGQDARRIRVNPLCVIKGNLFTAVRTPGSVDCYRLDASRYHILVCNNYPNYISSHVLTLGTQGCISATRLLLRKGLEIPDGISVSGDSRWIAVSNHVDGNIFVYANTPGLSRRSRPRAVLQGAVCPHGVRFSPSGRQLIVADAGSPYLHVFDRPTPDWRGTCSPSRSIQVLDDETFLKGRTNPREGGVKGLDIDPTGRLLVTTCEHQAIAFYDFNRLLDAPSVARPGELERLRRERDEPLPAAQGEASGKAVHLPLCSPQVSRSVHGIGGQ